MPSNAFTNGNGIMSPAGGVMTFAGTAAPSGWLLCDGSAISRVTYAALFTAIGTTHGVGDGSTTFNLPDIRGRIAAGKDNMGGTAANRLTAAGSGITGTTLGVAGGTETHTLTTAQSPAHTHGGSTGTVSADHGHTTQITYSTLAAGGFYALVYSGGGWNANPLGTQGHPSGGIDTNHTHAFTTDGGTGSGTAHNNTQPTIVLNYIIKT
jgi:microcystin-dependent protein